MKVKVISLGGSLIIPDSVNFEFLEDFKKALRKNYHKYKFVVVCGGGSIARKYIEALREDHKSANNQSEAGIRATRMNAMFLMQFFGTEANQTLPKDMHEVKNLLKRNKVVICGALRHSDNATSDTTSAKLAHLTKSDFINMTNVKGLYDKDPRKNKGAKFIDKISWKDFQKMTKAMKYNAGQHFVLDQSASDIIKQHKIKTYILGDIKQLVNLLSGKRFIGTLIAG